MEGGKAEPLGADSSSKRDLMVLGADNDLGEDRGVQKLLILFKQGSRCCRWRFSSHRGWFMKRKFGLNMKKNFLHCKCC